MPGKIDKTLGPIPGVGRGKHPNSLAVLGRAWTKEEAKEAQLKGAKVRTERAIQRNAIKESLSQWKVMKKEILSEGISAIDTLKILLAKAIHDEEFDTAADLAVKLAEYEKPKLARQEVKVENATADQLTDEELDTKLKLLMKDVK